MQTLNGFIFNLTKVSNLATAKNIMYRRHKMHMIVMGCDGMFWIVSAAAAQRLEKMGYEIAA